MPTHTKFKGVTEFGKVELTDSIHANLKTFYDWGFLEIGGFTNVNIPTSGVYGGTFHTLRPSKDPRFTEGRVWQSARKDWVWESGLEYSVQPIQISGVNVGSTFRPIGTPGSSGYVIDYSNGKVIFNSPLSTNSNVNLAYSYRRVQFVTADDKFFMQIQPDSVRVDDSNLTVASGVWGLLPENRLQLPAVGIEVVPRRDFTGAQLGGGHYMEQWVNLYIISETPTDRNKIFDILSKQISKKIFFFNLNLLASSNRFPLTPSGDIATNAICYPDLVKAPELGGFQWKGCYFKDAEVQNIGTIKPGLYGSLIRVILELDMPEV